MTNGLPGYSPGRGTGLLNTGMSIAVRWLEWLFQADPDVVRHAVRVSVWGRWYIWLVGVVLLARRPDLWYPEDIGFGLLNVSLATINGVVHHRIWTHRPVTWRWMLALCCLDITLITAFIAVSGRFDNLIFVTYYPALAIFAVVFSSIWIVLAWVTATAVVYTVVVLVTGPGLNVEVGQDHVLTARLSVMYLVAVGVNLITRFERSRWQASVERERQLRRERIEISQNIHDTSAQTSYMIGLGIHRARELAGDSNPELAAALDATMELSRSAMWEMRGPIDAGHIIEGRELGRVLWSHCATFERITGIPVEVSQTGDEPPLATETRTRLFSFAHNALTNAFLHARAGKVDVKLDFEPEHIRLSVSDDGVGLPADYAERGRGFTGMAIDAERMGGSLTVESSNGEDGTTITCVVPHGTNQWQGGD